MHNPFENEHADYHVLMNEEEQYSLWPKRLEIPLGWVAVYGPDKLAECQAYIDQNWTDMRPKSLREKMKAADVK